MQLVPITTAPYVQVNMAIELCLILRLMERSETYPVGKRYLVVACALLIFGSAPWLFMVSGPSGGAVFTGWFVGPWTHIGTMVVLLVGLMHQRRRTRRTRALALSA